jgi:serine/threonine-protein kinase
VLSAAEATVYVNGVAAGPTNHPLEVRCGQFFLRLGAPTPQGTAWLGPGKTVVIECEAAGEIAF